MSFHTLAFVIAYLGATTAVSLPWTLGDEYTVACFTLGQEDLATPPGLFMRWITPPSKIMRATTSADVAYELVVTDNFWNATSNKVLLGPKYDFYRNACTSVNPDCNVVTADNCCVWHANVHACLSSSFQCEPWVSPTNGTNGAILATGTASQVGSSETYRTGLTLPEGTWIILAHVKVMTFQCAIGANRLVLPPPVAANAPKTDDTGLTVALSVVLGFGVIATGLLYLYHVKGKTRSVTFAPVEGSVTLLFTDIENSTMLWGEVTLSMGWALDRHHEVIRECIARHSAYEVKTIGDSFMIAVKSASAGVALARDIQLGLHASEWPQCLEDFYSLSEGVEDPLTDDPKDLRAPPSNSPWNGLRVRIGIHTGTPACNFDEIHMGWDYNGPDVNLAARIESVAHGGQILISSGTLAAVSPPNASVLGVGFVSKGLASLKGLRDPVELHEVTVDKLSGREFTVVVAQNEWSEVSEEG